MDHSPPPAAEESTPKPERLAIPAGTFSTGTAPGDYPRNPELEPGPTSTALGPFSIDAFPYPGAGAAPQTKVTREEAEVLCGGRGGRLCTELEWERACKGPESKPFASGIDFDARCVSAPDSCVSGFGVRALGSLLEWTRSDVESTGSRGRPAAAVRGASADEPPAAHRCARRQGVEATRKAEALGFRCCYGPPNAVRIAAPKLGQTFEKFELSLPELERLLRQDAATRPLAKDLVYFREPDAAQTVLERGDGASKGFLFTVAPLRWNPVAGGEFLVVSARSGQSTSFVVVYHLSEPGQFHLASSFVMQDEVGPVALAYNGYIRPRLHFSTCWGCPGETGKILYRDQDRVAILQP